MRRETADAEQRAAHEADMAAMRADRERQNAALHDTLLQRQAVLAGLQVPPSAHSTVLVITRTLQCLFEGRGICRTTTCA